MKSIRRLPVICGYGGINSAGRSAFDLAYKRLVFNLLSQEEKNEVILDLQIIFIIFKLNFVGDSLKFL